MKAINFILGAALMTWGVAHAETQTTTANTQSKASTETAQMQNMTEPDITKIMKVANEGEIDAGKLAKKRANNAKVKEFANKMVREHEGNEKEVKKIAKKDEVGGMDNNAMAKDLKEKSKQTMKDLKDKKDSEFDKAYMMSQVEMHQSLLNEIDNNLMPAATTPALKDYLSKTRAHVKEHLDEAQSIEATLK